MRPDPNVTPYRMLIDGRLVTGAASMEVINPATGAMLTHCPRADGAQLEQAVAAARTAFPGWAALRLSQRRQLLLGLAAALESNLAALARLLTQEQGKPLSQASAEISRSAGMLRAVAAFDLPIEVLKENPRERIHRQHVPLGVVAAIVPWNSPMLLLMVKLAPALLAGNTLIVKPAPTTPLTTLRFGELAAQILPRGVLNIITDQNDLGGELTRHPDIAKVSFTGSTATGRKVMASAAATLKRLTVELGGNDAAIVLDDADPRVVAPRLFDGAMVNCGQVCLAIKRLYVPDALYDSFCSELATLAARAIVGDGLDPGTQIGPVQNQAQFNKLERLLEDTRLRAQIIAGGRAIERPGYFIAPTIVRDIAESSRLVREEQFGPILPVLRYTELDEAIARANHSEYGLGGSVWSADTQRAYGVALRLQTGIVWINKHLELAPDVPFGGTKQSGFGTELGQEGLEAFTQAKIINMAAPF